ncbi:PREDICTED: pentatricopeptide repeat-containing protein At3g29230 [Camelina sativa]|uniref:Pentatricopeptide repeat-containing protein At3g29230 n=1 Tax=Camelina sativa TaxID=90675 RepID=A0ABM0YLL3_CAMSA|nr:PREDICTED: pentatricopeptide repeat-containing protein At3g29230 [Camelina sativa]
MMTSSLPVRAPSWVSSRRIFEERLQELPKCANLSQVKQLHAQIIRRNLHQDLHIAPKLISALSLCRQTGLALRVFNQVSEPNVHLCNSLIRAHALNSQPYQAFFVFSEMQRFGLFADNFTYPFLLKACSGQSWLPVVKMMHSHIEKLGLSSDIYVPNALIDCYSRCGGLGVREAMKLFEKMGERDTVSWNSMLGGLVKAGELRDARQLFDEMPQRDLISWNTMLDGYARCREMSKAFELFEKMPERNTVSWSTMVMGYSKAGDMEMAKIMFDKMPLPAKNVVTWTIIIAGYAEKGLVKEADKLVDQMVASGLRFDAAAAISILAACAESGLLSLGVRVHSIIKRSNLNSNASVLNALLDMYAKCGSLEKAFDVFNNMPKKDLVSWNTMLHGLGVHGHGKEAIELFSRMRREGIRPDKVTFIAVLCSCNHAGLIDEGVDYFYSMEKVYDLVPQVEHYGCLVDLLGRGGRLKEAVKVVQTMPMKPNVVIWGALLGACRMHNNVDLAKEILDPLVKLDSSDPGNYTLLSNIYAAAEDWAGVADIRSKMKSMGVEKPSGASSVELEDGIHEFTVFDKSHPKSDQIYQMLGSLNEPPDTGELVAVG